MARLVLVGGDGKRIHYFRQAASERHTTIAHHSWEEYPAHRIKGDVVKLDPLPFDGTDLAQLPPFARRYCALLERYAAIPGIRYLNHPADILAALDKQETRCRLQGVGALIPQGLEADTYHSLCAAMDCSGTTRVFVKPRYGAGASGICAYARAGGREVLYTPLYRWKAAWHNTKRIHCYRDHDIIAELLDVVLGMDAVVERWVAKRSVGGVSFDLRVVWQGGGIAAVVARGSEGPITNLHLNSMALDPALTSAEQSMVSALCARAMACFPGLYYAGIDVLLPAGGGAPLILEVNAQGDLIHRNIYADNSIYHRQIQTMREWLP